MKSKLGSMSADEDEYQPKGKGRLSSITINMAENGYTVSYHMDALSGTGHKSEEFVFDDIEDAFKHLKAYVHSHELHKMVKKQ